MACILILNITVVMISIQTLLGVLVEIYLILILFRVFVWMIIILIRFMLSVDWHL